MLPLCIGEGTKIAQFLNTADKEYTGIIRLGSETDTGDPTGTRHRNGPVPEVDAAQLTELAQRFLGESMQIPPMYSAIKHQGYAPLRAGATGHCGGTAASSRPHRCPVPWSTSGAVAFDVVCSKGTYVRVLAQDIAVALGLSRASGSAAARTLRSFRVEEAVDLEGVRGATLPLIGLREALRELREIRLDTAAAQRARQGFEPLLADISLGGENEVAKLVAPDGSLTSIIVMDGVLRWRFARVFTDSHHAGS